MRASAQTDRAPRVNPAALWPLPWPVFGVAAIAVVYLVAPIVAPVSYTHLTLPTKG